MSIGFENYATPISKEILERAFKILSSDFKTEFIKSLPSSKRLTRNDIVKKLTQYYEKEKLVLVLGAGVSMGFGLPNWDTLLQKLMITTIEKERNVSTVLSKIFTSVFSPSPLIAGRYLQKFYEDKKMSFEEAVHKVLYEQLDIQKDSLLMDEIVNFCASPGKSPNLDSIISYNFDDILEQRLSMINIEVPHTPIYGIGMNSDGTLPIYHVHGYLPHKEKLTKQHQITFGESIYHKQYIDIYSWNNIVQINKFRESNCLFIGSSLTDPNIRRLLDIAKKQKGENDESHFIFKMRHKEENVKRRLEVLLKENKEILDEKSKADLNFDDTVKFLINIIERFEESDTESFGVKTIWINDWNDIPAIMKSVRLRNGGIS